MLSVRIFLYVALSAELSSCVSVDRVESLEHQIQSLQRSVEKQRQASKVIADHQQDIDQSLESLYDESQVELARLRGDVDRINERTRGIEFVPDEAGTAMVPAERGQVVLSNSRSSFWESSGGRNPNALGNHRYEMVVSAAGRVVIDLYSSNQPSIDTYLYLLSTSGQVIASDNDGGTGSYSRLGMNMEPGRYVIVAATYDAGVNGPYVLKIDGKRVRLSRDATDGARQN